MPARPCDLETTPVHRRRHRRLRATAIGRLDTAPVPLQPTHDQIARRAYDICQRRGSCGGDPTSDWLEAERELLGAASMIARLTDPLDTLASEGGES